MMAEDMRGRSQLSRLFAPGQRIPELDDDDLAELTDLVLEALAARHGKDIEVVEIVRDYRARQEQLQDELLEHVELMVGYWAGEGLSNVQDASKREALDGLAFSLLVMLDGGAAVGPYVVRPIGSDGILGPDLAGSLHERLADRERARRRAES